MLLPPASSCAVGARLTLKKKSPKRLLIGLGVLFVGIQFFQPTRTNPGVDESRAVQAQTQVPAAVSAILSRACEDCHSHKTRWPWYSYVAPMSWIVADDVALGRQGMNFSEWANYEREEAGDLLEGLCEQVEEGEMPLLSYRLLHPAARLSSGDVSAICEWSREERRRLSSAEEQRPSEN